MPQAKQSNKLYKIRHDITGLYSTGGYYPRWTKSGKTWSQLGTLRAHLSSHLGNSWRAGTDMSQWRVVEIEIRETASHEVHEMLNAKQLMRILTQKSHTNQ